MVKLLNPLFSNSAHGRLANIVYESGPYGQYAKVHTPQKNKPAQSQYEHNLAFGEVSESWKELTDEQKKNWNVKARGMKMSGFNLYVKENIVIT